MFAATDFEFKYRFWIFGALFWIAFSTYFIDHKNVVQALLEWNAGRHGASAPDWQYHAMFAIAALFCLANAAVRTWGTAYLNPEVMVDSRIHSTRLVADGPYRYVRNPLYFGNVLLAIGVGLMTSRIGFVILVGGMIVFVYRLVLREEAAIRASQEDSFRAYCAAVPRLFPALRPKLSSAGAIPDWKDGFLGEAFMWVSAASVVAFAITLNLIVFQVVLVSAFAAYAICYAVIKKRQQKTTADEQSSNPERPSKQAGQSGSQL